jgi:hypothetical protein
MAETMAPDDVARLIDEALFASTLAREALGLLRDTCTTLRAQKRKLTRPQLDALEGLIARFPNLDATTTRIEAAYPEAAEALRERIQLAQAGEQEERRDRPAVH